MKTFNKLVLIGTLFFFACSSDDEPKPGVSSRLIDSEYVTTWAAGTLRGNLDAFGLDLQNDKIIHDVDVYRITYETQYKESTLVVSGMVYLPLTDKAVSFVSFQHGTIAEDIQAPSNLSFNNTQHMLMSSLAGTGFITCMPDYVGFGSTAELMHPYFVEEPSALVVIDNLRAAHDLAEQLEIKQGRNLYLSGYSQGGYVTMAAHKYLEEHDVEFFELQASFPASGGYDIKAVRDQMFAQEIYEVPFFIAYVSEAYRDYYPGILELDEVFNPPYATLVDGIFDGINSGEYINSVLNDTLSLLLTPDFYADPDGNQFSDLSMAFEENSLLDWTPQVSMHMYHGDADYWVPYQTSVDTYNQFISSGASTATVTLTPIPGADHGGGVWPYIVDMTERLIELEGL